MNENSGKEKTEDRNKEISEGLNFEFAKGDKSVGKDVDAGVESGADHDDG